MEITLKGNDIALIAKQNKRSDMLKAGREAGFSTLYLYLIMSKLGIDMVDFKDYFQVMNIFEKTPFKKTSLILKDDFKNRFSRQNLSFISNKVIEAWKDITGFTFDEYKDYWLSSKVDKIIEESSTFDEFKEKVKNLRKNNFGITPELVIKAVDKNLNIKIESYWNLRMYFETLEIQKEIDNNPNITQKELAEKFGKTQTNISRMHKLGYIHYNVKVSTIYNTEEFRDKIIESNKNGNLTRTSIAEDLGTTILTINKAIKYFNLKDVLIFERKEQMLIAGYPERIKHANYIIMKNKNKSYRLIAKEIGLSTSGLKKLIKYNVLNGK